MPVSTKHPQYVASFDMIQTVEDAVTGNVKQEKYIPRLTDQSQAAWDAYVGRAAYYNVTERTLVALVGALLRKPYSIEGLVGDVPNVDETTFDEFLQRAYRLLFTQARVALHVDYDDVAGTPKLIAYASENIINWSDDFKIIEESVTVRDEDDPYVLKSIPQWRELYLDDGVYNVRVWRQVGRSEKYEVIEQYTPTIRGATFDFIPFWLVTPYDNSDTVYTPPLASLAELNVLHLRFSVDLGHGLHFTALPQPVISGDLQTHSMDPNAPVQKLSIGSENAWLLTPGSTASYLEFAGTGLAAVSNHIKSIEEQMYSSGSRLLTVKRGVESAEALQLRSGSESAVLVTMALSLENALTSALEVYNKWAGSSAEPVVKLNKDFTAAPLDPAQMKVLIEAYNAGILSLDTFLNRLYEGEVVADVEAEKAALGEARGPASISGLQ